MEILIYHRNKKAESLIQFLTESHYGPCTHITNSLIETIEFIIDHGSIHLVIAESTSENEKLIKFMTNLKTSIPLFLIFTDENEARSVPEQKGVYTLSLKETQHQLIQVIKDLFSNQIANSENEKFCKINADLLASMSNLQCDVFIKLSDHKYVKLFKGGTVFSKDDIEKLIQSKKVRNLYLHCDDLKVFIDCYYKDLMTDLNNHTADEDQLFKTISRTNDLIHELSHKIGFSSDIQALAKASVSITLKMIGTHPKISKALAQSLVKGQNYISNHSLMLANIACAIAAKMDWPSNTTFHKLVLASLFHDFTLSDPQLAKVATLEDLNKIAENKSSETYKEIHSHPLKSAELLRGMKEIPGDVDFLVFQHHERPDGSGFPKGLRSHQIVALSAVFIFAHDMVEEILTLKLEFNLEQFLIKNANTYNSGVFKKIWNIMADRN